MYLYGASGHCKVIIDILLQNHIEIKGVFDDNPKYENILGVPVMLNNGAYNNDAEWIISIGNNKIRKKIAEKLGGTFLKAIHPSAVVSKWSRIGEGTVVMAGAVINPDAAIGEHCIINTGAVIEHDCTIESYVHISPNASLAGGVHVGEGSHVGIGASVIQGVKIGKWVTIGAGSVVIRDVPDHATVVGIPAKPIRFDGL